MGLQACIICLGKSVFQVVNDGLTGKQWGICFGFSAITFVVSIITKLLPLQNYIDKCLVSEEEEEEEELEDGKDKGKTKRKPKIIRDDEVSGSSVFKLKKKPIYIDQANSNEARRLREDRDILKISENSSIRESSNNEKENI